MTLAVQPDHTSSAFLGADQSMHWLLWQLADSSFPIGGFAHSSGLEAAWQQGEVRGRDGLLGYLEATLDQLGRGSVPLLTAAYDAPGRLAEWDQLCDAFTSNHVANRASRTQGRALVFAVRQALQTGNEDPRFRSLGTLEFGHFAPVFGWILGDLGIPREAGVRLFIFMQIRGLLGAAVRLNIVGPMEAQALLHAIGPRAESTSAECEQLPIEALSQAAPLLDLWQGSQDRLYSRLFQS
jgi:urease accessory protein